MEFALHTRNGTQDGTKTLGGVPFAVDEDLEGVRHTMETIVENYERRAAHDPAELPQAVESLLNARTADAVFVVDPNYRIVHWDVRSESLTGLMAEEMIGKPCYEVLRGECEGGSSFCSHQCSVMQLAQSGRPVSNYDMLISTRWGQKKWVNVSNLIVDSEEGPYLVHLVRDTQKTHETLEMARGLIELSSNKRSLAPDHRDLPTITPRQMEVLELLAEGKSAKEIGQALYLSQATVRNHVRSLLQALGAHSQLEALAKARQIGLLDR
jgi:PAS domain S-box-containing protein